MKEDHNTINDLILERFVLGELGQEEASRIESLRAAEPRVQARIENLIESNNRILSMYPPSTMAATIRARIPEQEPHSFFGGFRVMAYTLGCAVAIAGIVFFIFPAIFPGTQADGNRENILVKGDFGLTIFRQTRSGYERLANGARVRKGDRFQVKYNAGNEGFGVIFSIDGRGNLTLHYPQNALATPMLDMKGEVALLDAFELDDAPGFERFFFVVSANAFPASVVLDRGRELAGDTKRALAGSLELGAAFQQKSFSLIKEDSR